MARLEPGFFLVGCGAVWILVVLTFAFAASFWTLLLGIAVAVLTAALAADRIVFSDASAATEPVSVPNSGTPLVKLDPQIALLEQYRRANESWLHWDSMVNQTFPFVGTVAAALFIAVFYYLRFSPGAQSIVLAAGFLVLLAYSAAISHMKLYSDTSAFFCGEVEKAAGLAPIPFKYDAAIEFLDKTQPTYRSKSLVPRAFHKIPSFPFQFYCSLALAFLFGTLAIYIYGTNFPA
jgi:hypothetical protein